MYDWISESGHSRYCAPDVFIETYFSTFIDIIQGTHCTKDILTLLLLLVRFWVYG